MENSLNEKKDICFDNIEEALVFLNIANRYNEDINIYDGRFCFDGKSVVAMLNLTKKKLKLEIITDNTKIKENFYEEVMSNVKQG